MTNTAKIWDDYRKAKKADTDEMARPRPHPMLNRTSPYNTTFVGTCPACGVTGITLVDMSDGCANPDGITASEAVQSAVRSPNGVWVNQELIRNDPTYVSAIHGVGGTIGGQMPYLDAYGDVDSPSYADDPKDDKPNVWTWVGVATLGAIAIVCFAVALYFK